MNLATNTARIGFLALLALSIPQTGNAQEAATVTISPPSAQMAVGERRTVVATARTASGGVVQGAQVVWSSTNISQVSVSANPAATSVGTLEGLAPGLVTVEARVGNAVGAIPVQVTGPGGQSNPPSNPTPPAVQTPPAVVNGVGVAQFLQIEPGQLLLLPGESARLTPTFLNADGSPAAAEPVTWASLQLGVVSVDPNGEVIGISQGSGVIQGTTESGITGRVIVQIQQTPFGFSEDAVSLAPGLADTIRVLVPEQNHRILPSTALRWQSNNVNVAQVSPLGVITAVAGGRTEIVVSGFLQERRVTVAVHAEVTDLDFSPRASVPVFIPVEGTREFSVNALAANGNPVPEAILQWIVGDSTLFSFDRATATATGLRIGVDTLRVRAPGRGLLEVAWEIHVIEGGVSLGADRAGLAIGDQVTVTAQFTDDAGNPLGPASGIEWASNDASVATVDPAGTITGAGFGMAHITAATQWGSVDTIQIFVQGEILISSNRGGTLDVFSMARNSGVLHQVTSDPGQVTGASLSPDGTRIVYVSDGAGSRDIYLANADGSDATVVAGSATAQEDSPDWTADGNQIVYQSADGGPPQIWIMNADGTGKRQLTEGGSNSEPAVSTDGNIAFTSTRDGNYEVYIMGLDGSNPRNVTNSAGRENNPVWMPDGQVAFLVAQQSQTGQSMQVNRMDPLGGRTPISPPNMLVTDFAVSRSGDLLAMIVAELSQTGQTSKLVLLQLGGAAGPLQVQTDNPTERLFGVSFRR